MSEKKELTLKQRIWLQTYMDVEGDYFGNATKSALVAYFPDFPIKKERKEYNDEEMKTYKSAKQIGYENLSKLDIPINQLMNEAGLGDSYLLRVLAENLQATRLYGKNGIKHGDYSARNKALEMALKLKDLLKDKIDVEGGLFTRGKMELVTVDSDEDTEKSDDISLPEENANEAEIKPQAESNAQGS